MAHKKLSAIYDLKEIGLEQLLILLKNRGMRPKIQHAVLPPNRKVWRGQIEHESQTFFGESAKRPRNAIVLAILACEKDLDEEKKEKAPSRRNRKRKS